MSTVPDAAAERQWKTQEEESIAWFLREGERAERSKLGVWPEPISAFDLVRMPSPPEWYKRECEYDFRRGFYYGFAYAQEQVRELHGKGYGRPAEIANILGRLLSSLRNWMQDAFREDVEKPHYDSSHPELKWPSWPELRRAVFARDGRVCTACDSKERLEAHHRHPVCEGGVPEMKNLRTYCYACHRGPPDPAADKPDGLTTEQAELLLAPLASVTGFQWSWAEGTRGNHGIEGIWQLMPASSSDDGDFWFWHLDYRRQWFDNRLAAVASLIKSFNRWSCLQTKDAV